MQIRLPLAIIENVKTRADHSIAILISTRELTPEKMTEIFMAQKGGEEVSFETDVEASPKTPSARLRNCLYKLWENTTDKSIDFPIWYESRMERLINQIKDKLN